MFCAICAFNKASSSFFLFFLEGAAIKAEHDIKRIRFNRIMNDSNVFINNDLTFFYLLFNKILSLSIC